MTHSYASYVAALNHLIGVTKLPFSVLLMRDSKVMPEIQSRLRAEAHSPEFRFDATRFEGGADDIMVFRVYTEFSTLGYVMVVRAHADDPTVVRAWAIE